jgi:nucleoside-diphosphate-sugar epimerase
VREVARRVLVTGASGFIGRAAVSALQARGFDVHGVSRRGAVAAPMPIHAVDLLDPDAVDALFTTVRPSHVLHLAWTTTPGAYWTCADNARWQAAGVRLAAAASGARLVVAGTCAEYDWTGNATCDERDVCKPATPYGLAKLALQQHVAAVHDNAAWARIFLPFGPFEARPRLVPSVINALLDHQPALCSPGLHVRDFLYVEDVGNALAALVDSALTGIVNVASGTGVPVRDVALGLQARIGGEVNFQARNLPAGEPPTLIAAVHRLRDELGWSPAFTLDEGLDRTVAWWKRARADGLA